MRSTEIQLDRYATDKVASGYLHWYDPVLEPWVHREVRLLEIGIHQGGSLLLWRDYFPKAEIVGIDLSLPAALRAEPRVRMFQGSQGDTEFLSRVSREAAPQGWDIIIDDASHVAALSRTTFWHLFEHHLKPSGLYVIEDWGTGFWHDWPDGRSYRRPSWMMKWIASVSASLGSRRVPPDGGHRHGMVGFIKELIDEQGAADRTRGSVRGAPGRPSRFELMIVRPSVVFVQKAGRSEDAACGDLMRAAPQT